MTAYATEVVVALGAAKKAVQLYPPAHPTYIEAMDTLIGAVKGASAEGPFTLNWHQGRLYDGSVVIPEDIHGMDSVAAALEERGIESLTFQPGFARDDALGLTDVLSMKHDGDIDIDAELGSRGVTNVAVAYLAKGEEGDGSGELGRRQDRAMHTRVAAVTRNLTHELAEGGEGDLHGATAAVRGLLGRMAENPAAVIALATLRSEDGDPLFHSISVMIYAALLGKHLGLPEEGLERLAVAALLHDIGKAAFDQSDPIQAEASRTLHARVGAEILQRVVLNDPTPMLVAFEHHMAPDGSGFPERPADYVAHPYSRMVAIADRYEHLLHPEDGSAALTPDRAVVAVLREAGTRLDPFFVRAFANALGVFPIGCVVRLSDQTVGVVARPSDDPLAPVVRLAFDERGFEFSEPPEINLAAGFVRIVEIMQPELVGLDVSNAL